MISQWLLKTLLIFSLLTSNPINYNVPNSTALLKTRNMTSNRLFRFTAGIYCAVVLLTFQIGMLKILLLQCGDIEVNPGPPLSYEILANKAKEHHNFLKYITLNCRSIKNKYLEIRFLSEIVDSNTIIGLTETWLDDTCDHKTYSFCKTTHEIFRYDRNKKCTGQHPSGGTLLLIPKKFNPKI